MQVREIMSSNLQQISSSQMASEAAEKMKDFDVGALPVLEDNKIIGFLTDRDIVVRAIADGMDPKMTAIRDILTPGVVCCNEDDNIEEAGRIMEDNKVRRLVVLADDKTVSGVLSVGDLALKTSNHQLAYEVLERVCEPIRG